MASAILVIITASWRSIITPDEVTSRREPLRLTFSLLSTMFAWRYLIWLLKPVIRKSRRTDKEGRDFFSLEELRVVSHQIQGNLEVVAL